MADASLAQGSPKLIVADRGSTALREPVPGVGGITHGASKPGILGELLLCSGATGDLTICISNYTIEFINHNPGWNRGNTR
jgi:hypothetical protein